MWNIINIHNIAILLEVRKMKKTLFIIPLMFITLSCSSLNLYTENIKNINKINITSPQKRVPIKWWEN